MRWADNVVGITMPPAIPRRLGRRLGAAVPQSGHQTDEHPIKELVTTYARQFEASFGEPLGGLALENLQARARGTTLMEYSNCLATCC
jgi:NAD+ synthase (glutamine-hydrolysing)